MTIAFKNIAPEVRASELDEVITCKKDYKYFKQGERYSAISINNIDYIQNSSLIEVRNKVIKVYYNLLDYEIFKPDELVKYFQMPDEMTIERYDSMNYYKELVSKLYELYRLKKYDFQIEDVSLLMHKNTGLLASEQGCGKTLQSLAWLRLKKILNNDINNTLVICQQDLILQWQQEAKRLGVRLNRIDKKNDYFGDGNYITYYEFLKKRIEYYKDKFDLVILDEAHKIKSAATIRGKAIRRIKAKYKLCLTGTPVKNMIKDLFFILGWLNGFESAEFPYQEKDYIKFYKEFGSYEFTKTDRKFTPVLSNKEKLQRILSPTMVRRTLDTTGLKLVEKNIYRLGVDFTQEQKIEYVKILNDKTLDGTTRQWKLKHNLTTYPGNNKIQALTKLIDIFKNEQVIIYSTIIEAMNIFHSLFNNSRIANGEVPPPIREEIISDFKKGYFQILIAGIESMGTGHSLQNCRNVIVTDYGYTASGLDQAVYRVCRINSERNINIIKLYVKNSIEENRQLDLIDKKRESSEMLLDYSSNYNFQTIKL